MCNLLNGVIIQTTINTVNLKWNHNVQFSRKQMNYCKSSLLFPLRVIISFDKPLECEHYTSTINKPEV